MPADAYSAPDGLWRAPVAPGPLDARVRLPGSKSLTNRELVLSALATGPSRLVRPLAARDTDLMVAALRALGARIEPDGEDLVVEPGPLRGGTAVDVGLAGTLMRFLPPVAALADGAVRFDGDERARERPMATTIRALRDLGVPVDDDGRDALPFAVGGAGGVRGGAVRIDASASSQFVSGLLLAGARYDDGLVVEHRGQRLPSVPHVEMTLDVLRRRGVTVDAEVAGATGRWTVAPGAIAGRDVVIEPDLSNAAPFLAAALVAGGRVSVPDWPSTTTQVGDRLRDWLAAFGGEVALHGGSLAVEGPGVAHGPLHPVDLDLSEGGELAPTLVGLAAFADGTSTFHGIGHLRGHETDRLAALVAELGNVGVAAEETEDGIVVRGGSPAAGRPWRSHADHRMATTGALIGLAVPGVEVEDVASTAKTLPGFTELWARMLP
ncbi:3-phosphoshikimate 1-carboxyvinyltransferase [Amnibacterium endophyticum]|uniref:3-phosphoshikimate 1-carboxyvinyltransferase n=1 Tax=Amnibacterium endophyticum TaxID=2109337 RepID=A0ABW4LF86_9MICO